MSPLLNVLGLWAQEYYPESQWPTLIGRHRLPESFLAKPQFNYVSASWHEFQGQYRLGRFFSKWTDPVDGEQPNTRIEAIKVWMDDNNRAAAFTKRLYSETDPDFHDFHEEIRRRFQRAMRKVTLANVAKYFRHGPGRTSTRAGTQAVQVAKFAPSFSITRRMYNYLLENLFEEDDKWLYAAIRSDGLVIKNELLLDTVPKTALVDRVVTYEADLDVYVQLGIGSYICAQVLPQFNIWIKSENVPTVAVPRRAGKQWLIWEHQAHLTTSELHKQYVSDMNLATFDAKSGSNNWSSGYVWYLAEGMPELQQMLCACETPGVVIEDENVSYRVLKHIHAGMGNGVAFPLETLLFHLTTRVAGRDKGFYSTFGDDMIVSKAYASEIAEKLKKYTCIRLNEEKSHYLPEDRFLESCGEDTYDGVSVWGVRPKADPTLRFRLTEAQVKYYGQKAKNFSHLKSLLLDAPKSVRLKQSQLKAIYEFYNLLNGIARMARSHYGIEPSWHALHKQLLHILPATLQGLYTPSGNGGSTVKNRFVRRHKGGWDRYQGLCIRLSIEKEDISTDGNLVLRTRCGRRELRISPSTILAYALAGGSSDSSTRLSRETYQICVSE